MIPKQIFFIWFGDKLPKYAESSISVFKRINSGFKIDLIMDNLDSPTNNIVKDILSFYKSEKCSNVEVINVYNQESKTYTGAHIKNKKDILVVSDVLRVYLIYKYGGIYLDCDTFPVKPFDEDILKESFQAYSDNFWFGGIKGDIITNNNKKYQNRCIGKYIRTFYDKTLIPGIDYKKNVSIKSKLFLDGNLKYGDKVLDNYSGWDYYIDHYNHYIR